MHVDDKYRINVFLDTNVLIDVLDDSFKNLTRSINYLAGSDFVNLKSSHYVMFEMVENRKWKYFIDTIYEQIGILPPINKKYNWKINGVKYSEHKNIIQKKVIEDKDKIFKDYTIDWQENVLHDQLLFPTLDLCLESSISRNDSLVLLSSIFPKNNKREKQILLMSRDKDFNKSSNAVDLSNIFIKHDLSVPEMIRTGELHCKNNSHHLNLIDNPEHTEETIIEFWKQKIIETIISKNNTSFLGYTYRCNSLAAEKCVFFKLEKGKTLNNEISLTIIGRNLDFIYSTQIITEFWNNRRIDNYPFMQESFANISFLPYDKQDNIILEFQNLDLLSKIKEKGNLVFINEDGS